MLNHCHQCWEMSLTVRSQCILYCADVLYDSKSYYMLRSHVICCGIICDWVQNRIAYCHIIWHDARSHIVCCMRIICYRVRSCIVCVVLYATESYCVLQSRSACCYIIALSARSKTKCCLFHNIWNNVNLVHPVNQWNQVPIIKDRFRIFFLETWFWLCRSLWTF